jgi:hypothetical protein
MRAKYRKSVTIRGRTGPAWAVLSDYDLPTESDHVDVDIIPVPHVGHAISFCLEHGKSIKPTIDWIKKFFGLSMPRYKLGVLMEEYDKCRKLTYGSHKENVLAEF